MHLYMGTPGAFFEVPLVSPPRTITVATAMTTTIMVAIAIPATAVAIKVSCTPIGPVSVTLKLLVFRLIG